MSAARRAATYASLTAESHLAQFAMDASSLDMFCALSAALDRAGVSDAALGVASAEDDATIAAIARAIIRCRGLLSPLAAAPSPAFEEDRRPEVEVIEVPRAFLTAIGATASSTARVLRAAFTTDDAALIAALADDFDVAELRAAARLSGQRSLRGGLPTSGAAFRGIESRERAVAWSDRFEEIRRCGRRKRGGLRAAVAASGDEHWIAWNASQADAVWDAAPDPPTFSVRAALLFDACVLRDTAAASLVPFGNGTGTFRRLQFDDAPSGPVDVVAFARAVDVDVSSLAVAEIRVPMSWSAGAAAWLAGDAAMSEAIGAPEASVASRPASAAAGEAKLMRPLPEERSKVVSPGMTFSASRMNLYAKCPRRFFFEYLCDAVEETSTSNAVYGKAFHAALETLHRDVRAPALWKRDEVLDKLCAALDASFGLARHEFGSELEYAVLRLRARQVARHYVRWLFEEAADMPFEIVEVESRQVLLLDEHRFVGYIDRVDRPATGGPITIFDYKTGRVGDDPEAYLEDVRNGDEAQLALYYAMRRAQGDDVARIALVSLRDARDKTWVLALDIVGDDGRHVTARRDRAGVMRASCSKADLERSLDALTARCDVLTRDGLDHFDVGADPPCSYCAYALACREKPAAAERIFAR